MILLGHFPNSMTNLNYQHNLHSNLNANSSLSFQMVRKAWIKPEIRQIDFKLTAGGTGSTNVDQYKQS
jgi:hypothetical protein